MKTVLLLFAVLYPLSGFAQIAPEWMSFLTGPGNVPESAEKVIYDNSGNAYIIGYGYFTPGGQGQDFITVKCNTSGVAEWTAIYNGQQNGTDRPFGVCVDNSGNVYVTGTSDWSSVASKIITLKYSAAGVLQWICVFDSAGTSVGEAVDICADDNGNVYATGRLSPLNNGYYDLATIKMDADGNIIDSHYFGQVTTASDDGTNIIADNNGNIFSAGQSFSGLTNGEEVVILKYNSSLDTVWTIHVNGTDNSLNEFAIDLDLDDTGNLHALCRIQNTNSGTDYATLKINSDGQILWRTEFNENNAQDIPEDMVLDESGNVFVTGRTRRASGGGYNDFAVIKYNNAGVQQWVSYHDGPKNLDDDPLAINLDANGNVYVSGESNRTGSNFVFTVVKFNSSGNFEWEYAYDINESSRAFAMWIDDVGNVYSAGDGEGTNGNQDLMAVKLVMATDVNDDELLIKRFSLEQNYPNPFNPATTIRFIVGDAYYASPAWVTLRVYDVLGNEIATLVDEYKSPGNYESVFSSDLLPSGVYFYKLQSGNFIESKKMILLK
ncbi:MAG: SBBP repeat-containing protein [Ignavibacteriales bacterium]|nr:MAG: SBBP repeat-containing protein [Ignavibacteriales bacterium]